MRAWAQVATWIGGAVLVVALLSIGSGIVLSRARLVGALQDAFVSEALPPNTEGWAECAMLTMQYLRYENPFRNAVDTRWIRHSHHACDELRALVAGPPYALQLRPVVSYPNYPFGARHLQSFFLRTFSVSWTITLFHLFSYGSLVLLVLGAWRNSPRAALTVMLPIALFLAFAFAQHRWANSMTWAPGFFVGFFLLAAFLSMPDLFRSRAHRAGFFSVLGIVAAYFDNLHGPIPVLLSLSIVLNHVFYVARTNHDDWRRYARTAVFEVLLVFAAFFLAYAALTCVRLSIVSTFVDSSWHEYVSGLGQRAGDVVSDVVGRIHLGDVARALWSERSQLTGNTTSSTVVLWASAACWGLSLALLISLPRPFGKPELCAVTDFLVLAVAGAGILAWYAALMNHSHSHAWLMVRMLALPASYGFVALIPLIEPCFLERGGQKGRKPGMAFMPVKRTVQAFLVLGLLGLTISIVFYLSSTARFGKSSARLASVLDEIMAQNEGTKSPGFGSGPFPVGEGAPGPGFLQHPPSSRVAYRTVIDLQRPVFEGVVGIHVDAHDKSDGAGFLLEIRSGGKIERVFSAFLNPKEVLADRVGRPFRLDLSRYAGREVEFLFSTDPGPKGNKDFDWAGWAKLQFVSLKESEPPAAPPLNKG